MKIVNSRTCVCGACHTSILPFAVPALACETITLHRQEVVLQTRNAAVGVRGPLLCVRPSYPTKVM